MAKELKAIDVDDAPELARVVEEVRHTREPRVLRLHGKEAAVLRPVGPSVKRRGRRQKTEADHDPFRAVAGGGSDVHTAALIADVYESRDLWLARKIAS